MKRFFLLTFLQIILGAFIISCSKINIYSQAETPYHYGILKNINDTITTHPEEALKLLHGIDKLIIDNIFSEQEYHEYQILLSEVNYKNFYNQTNHNEVIIASNYFDSLNLLYPQNTEITFLYSKSLYYKAVGFEELENSKDAFKSYLKSLELLEDINLNKKKK